MKNSAREFKDGSLSPNERLGLYLQSWLGWVSLLPIYAVVSVLVRFRGHYTISGFRAIRMRFKEITSNKAPLIVCANHLTLIDSVLMMRAFASPLRYLFSYRLLCWNIPAIENTKKKLSWLIITYLAKCILIERMGSASHTAKIVDKLSWLIPRGELVMLFPEGTRSRSGRIDPHAINYGVGKILQRTPGCRVICVYQRGRRQATFSDFPARGDVIDMDMQVITPRTDAKGRRAISELSNQIINKLQEMEQNYLTKKGVSRLIVA